MRTLTDMFDTRRADEYIYSKLAIGPKRRQLHCYEKDMDDLNVVYCAADDWHRGVRLPNVSG